ncbi:hypothetical protein ACP4OV_015315 [Aristida adscensionis]
MAAPRGGAAPRRRPRGGAGRLRVRQVPGGAVFPALHHPARARRHPALDVPPANGTAAVAFRAPQSAAGWVAWGINTGGAAQMAGSSVLIASQDGGGVASVLTTVLESTSPSLSNGSLGFDVPAAPAAEYATVALPRNATRQSTVWQAGPVSGGRIAPHRTSGPNLQSTMRLDFVSGDRSTGAPSSRPSRRNLRAFQG